jgi:hypothetical protein
MSSPTALAPTGDPGYARSAPDLPASLRRAMLARKNGAIVKKLSQIAFVRATTAAVTLTTLVTVVGAGKKWG